MIPIILAVLLAVQVFFALTFGTPFIWACAVVTALCWINSLVISRR